MKNMKKALPLLLVLCMLAALSVSAFAEGKTFENYLLITDSIGVYCGVPAPNNPHIAVYSHPNQTFPGTYSELLKNDQSLGIHTITSCAHPGWRVQEALYALGGADYTSDYILKYAGDTAERMKTYSQSHYVQALENADLITINLGFNNIMQAFIYGLYTAFEQEGIAFEGSKLDKAAMEALNRLKENTGDVEAFVTLLGALETMERGTVLIKNALKMMPEAIRGFEKSWDELMERISQVNRKNAAILVLGLYNPMDDVIKFNLGSKLGDGALKKITDTTAWLLKEATDPTVDAMNRYLRSGNRHAHDYVFVDVDDVELSGTKDGVHLGDAGHQYFYEQMKNAIVTHFIPESVPATKTTPAGLLGKLFSGLKNLF